MTDTPEGKSDSPNVPELSLSLLDNFLEGCQLISSDWRYLYVNDVAAKHGKKTKEELIGKTMMEVFPCIEGTEMFAVLRQCMESRSPQRMENKFRYADGSSGCFELKFEPVPEGVFILSHDISERKQAEEKNLQLEAQFQHAQKMEAVGRLAGGVAHDYNNILGVIIGYCELCMDNTGDDNKLQGYLNEILAASKRSKGITQQLLAFARKDTITPEILDLNATVENMLNILRKLIGEYISLVWCPGKVNWPVLMDPCQLDQILANLCVNSRDAITDVGQITIETSAITIDADYCSRNAGFKPGDFVLLTVSDDGSGMDSKTMNNIFEPFFTTKGVGEGTGLGLSTIHGIVKQNSGFINVYSEPGCGTTFRIYLPRYSGGIPEKKRLPDKQVPGGNGETVLVVEDEIEISRLAEHILSRLNYKVISANRPSEALKIADDHKAKISLLLTDVIMPEMNGRELARQLKTIHPELKCLFMSGYTANVIENRGVVDKKIQFIQKPFSIKELAAKVRETLDLSAMDYNDPL